MHGHSLPDDLHQPSDLPVLNDHILQVCNIRARTVLSLLGFAGGTLAPNKAGLAYRRVGGPGWVPRVMSATATASAPRQSLAVPPIRLRTARGRAHPGAGSGPGGGGSRALGIPAAAGSPGLGRRGAFGGPRSGPGRPSCLGDPGHHGPPLHRPAAPHASAPRCTMPDTSGVVVGAIRKGLCIIPGGWQRPRGPRGPALPKIQRSVRPTTPFQSVPA